MRLPIASKGLAMHETLASESSGISPRAPRGGIRPCGRGFVFRDGSACLALALGVLIAILLSPIQRSSTSSHSHRSPEWLRRNFRSPEWLRRNFAFPASAGSRLSVNSWSMHEDVIANVRSEYDENEDESCGEAGLAYDVNDPSRSSFRRAPARKLAVPARLSALHPLRC
jgi:hypothetical protein